MAVAQAGRSNATADVDSSADLERYHNDNMHNVTYLMADVQTIMMTR